MIMPLLGIVTIGQSPRTDMVPELRRWLDGEQIAERGALDNLSAAEAGRLGPVGPEDRLLVSRMRDGSSVKLGVSQVHPLVCGAVRDLEDRGVAATLIVCTGELPPVPHRKTLLHAEALLAHGVRGITGGAQLGVLCPDPATHTRWNQAHVASASPYATGSLGQVAAAAESVSREGAEFVVMDCMGYDLAAREVAVRASGRPALLAREIVARLTAAALGGLR